ncbi:MAG: hypothetical protein ABSE71_02535 [Candidatus Micrarchaeaceae archaeon]|jgi:hypothetical protein
MTTQGQKNKSDRKSVATFALLGFLTANPIAPRLEAQSSGSCTERSSVSPIEKKLSETQLSKYFGIGNPTPSDAKTYGVGKGWQGEGVYRFSDGKTTCYLNTANMLNDWYYAKFDKERDAPEDNGKLQPPDPEVRDVVHAAHSKKSKLLRVVGGAVEMPAKAVGGISPVSTGAKEGPIHVGAATPGVEAGAAGTVTPNGGAPTQSTSNPPAVQATNAPATAVASADPVENLRRILTAEQLQNYFGIGNMTPYGVKTYSQAGGWQGNGIYNFDSKKFSTPPLSTQEQLGNWYYLLYGQSERADELAGKPLTPELKWAVDKARRNSN